ncbi:MAG: AMP-binding protein [Actinomycetota bacterium]|nr:AMP-binding protein [Actinomycetota bacterium]
MPRRLDYASLFERFAWDLPSNYNIGVDVCDRHAADKGRLAIIHDRRDGTAEKWTFWELKRASDRFANALRTLGIERGDRVAVLLSQSLQLPIVHIATYKLGAVVVPLFTLFGEEALRFRLGDSGAKVIVTDLEHFEVVSTLREELDGLRDVILVDGERSGARTSAGYRIGPVEIEETLVKHRDVLMAAAVGKLDPVRGQVVKVFVVLREGSGAGEDLAAELKGLVKDRLGAHEYPREIEFVDELPMTPTGKVRRKVFRQREAAKT